MSSHLSYEQIEQKLSYILNAPKNEGQLKLIVTRPVSGERVYHDSIELTAEHGVKGDKWVNDCYLTLEDGRSDPDVQVCITNARCMEIVAQDSNQRGLAGDNLFIDMDLSVENLKPKDQLTLGTSILEITAQPHNACLKFANRFGRDAAKFVNDKRGRHHKLRGVYAKVVKDGVVTLGDTLKKLK